MLEALGVGTVDVVQCEEEEDGCERHANAVNVALGNADGGDGKRCKEETVGNVMGDSVAEDLDRHQRHCRSHKHGHGEVPRAPGDEVILRKRRLKGLHLRLGQV
mgnify:CR=1 FL=1